MQLLHIDKLFNILVATPLLDAVEDNLRENNHPQEAKTLEKLQIDAGLAHKHYTSHTDQTTFQPEGETSSQLNNDFEEVTVERLEILETAHGLVTESPLKTKLKLLQSDLA